METAWLVVNGYLKSEKFEEIYSWLIEAAKERNINLKKLPNDQLDSIIPADPENVNWRERPEFVLFWDKDVNLARMLEREGFRVFNNADGIEACDDKALTFIRLKNKNIKMPKTFIKDVRIHVVGDEIVTAMERVNENDFRANITNGGKMKKYTPTKEQAQMAIDVCRELNLDFAGVDIMFGKEGEPVLCEVNSNAHFKNIYDCTGVNVAESILDYIVKSIKD